MALNNKVKIFVSHRIDLDSVTVKNNVYYPVRCGACFDSNYTGEIAGDNTGENISQFRMKLGEFTVQYWAWKNIEADYYGLCHYRRYLSFADKRYPTDEKQQVIETFLDEHTIGKYRLNNPEYITEFVSKYDAVVGEYAQIGGMYTPRGPQKTVYEHFCAYDGYLINKEDIDLFLDTVDELYPKIGKYAREYFAGNRFRGYNCFVLKRDLFFQLCEMETEIMQAIQKSGKINFDYRTSLQSRTYGFFTEWIYGCFIYYLEKATDRKIKTVQLVFFENTEKPIYPSPLSERVPVAYLVNRYLMPAAMVSIQSLLEHKKSSTQYDVILLHYELTADEQREIVANFQDEQDISIRCLDIKKNLPSASNGLRWDQTLNAPSAVLFLPWLLPEYERVIFLHTDVFAKTDLYELNKMDFGANWVIAPLDFTSISENNADRDILEIRKHKLAMENPYQYFSTSIMAMNLMELRKKILFDQMMRYGRETNPSRDIMNRICSGKVKILDAAWNVCPPANGQVKWMLDFLPAFYSAQCVAAQKAPKIIHYQGYPKPWQMPFREETSDFWLLARNTIFYERLLAHSIASVCAPSSNAYPAAGRSFPRRVADRLLPLGTRRREFAKKIIPRGSHRWNILKSIYHFLRK